MGIYSKSSLRSSGQGKFLLCKWCMVISSLLKHSLQERKAHSGGKQNITSPKRKKHGKFLGWLSLVGHKPMLVGETGEQEAERGSQDRVAGKPGSQLSCVAASFTEPQHSVFSLCVWMCCLHVFPHTTCVPGVYGDQKRASDFLSWSYRAHELAQELGIEPKSP